MKSLDGKCTLRDKTSSLREEIKKMLDGDFIFPSSEEMYNINLKNESLVYEEIISTYENNLHTEKMNWEKISDENDNLRDLIFQENQKADSMSEKLLQKLDVSDKKYKEVCDVLCTLVYNGNSLSAKEIERREKARKLEIKNLKESGKNADDKYIALLKDNKGLKREVKMKGKRIEEIQDKLLKSLTDKRKLQK